MSVSLSTARAFIAEHGEQTEEATEAAAADGFRRYVNTRVYCPSHAGDARDQWHASVAVSACGAADAAAAAAAAAEASHGRRRLVLLGSNHFLTRISEFHDVTHHVYSRLRDAYQRTVSAAAAAVTTISAQRAIWCANAFAGVNSGHDLSILCACVQLYQKLAAATAPPPKLLLSNAATWHPNNLNLVRLLVPESDLVLLPWDTVCAVPHELYVPSKATANVMAIPAFTPTVLAHMMRRIEPRFAGDAYSSLRGQKIAMIKCDRNAQVTRRDTALTCERLIAQLESPEHGFTFVNPERVHVYELAYRLRHATHIVCSWGGLLYTNMPFFNPSRDTDIRLLRTDRQALNHHWADIVARATRRHDMHAGVGVGVGVDRGGVVTVPSTHRNLDESAEHTRNVLERLTR